MKMIAVGRNGTEVAAGSKSLAVDGAQRPFVALANEDLDEALWAAYRRNDKTAGTEGLRRHYLHRRRDNQQPMRGARHG